MPDGLHFRWPGAGPRYGVRARDLPPDDPYLVEQGKPLPPEE